MATRETEEWSMELGGGIWGSEEVRTRGDGGVPYGVFTTVESSPLLGMRRVKSHDSSQMTRWGNFLKESQSHESLTDDSSH